MCKIKGISLITAPKFQHHLMLQGHRNSACNCFCSWGYSPWHQAEIENKLVVFISSPCSDDNTWGWKSCIFCVSSTNSTTWNWWMHLILCMEECVHKRVILKLGALSLFFKFNSLYILSSISVLNDYHCFQKIHC